MTRAGNPDKVDVPVGADNSQFQAHMEEESGDSQLMDMEADATTVAPLG